MTPHLPAIAEAKRQARRLRHALAAQGRDISHAEALEGVARHYGFRDWNAMHAAMGHRPPDGWAPGGRVAGRYLSHPFTATVIAAEMLRPGWFRLVLDLDVPVDVVRFESFSNFRKRIRAVVGPDGHTRERTSDGEPHVRLDLGSGPTRGAGQRRDRWESRRAARADGSPTQRSGAAGKAAPDPEGSPATRGEGVRGSGAPAGIRRWPAPPRRGGRRG